MSEAIVVIVPSALALGGIRSALSRRFTVSGRDPLEIKDGQYSVLLEPIEDPISNAVFEDDPGYPYPEPCCAYAIHYHDHYHDIELVKGVVEELSRYEPQVVVNSGFGHVLAAGEFLEHFLGKPIGWDEDSRAGD